jgi:hypothetical protein
MWQSHLISHSFPVPVSRSLQLQVSLLASQPTESAAGGEPCGEPAISHDSHHVSLVQFASRHNGHRFKSPGGYLCETGILLLALSRYIAGTGSAITGATDTVPVSSTGTATEVGLLTSLPPSRGQSSGGALWTPGYTPTDRLTSWGVLHYPCTVPVYCISCYLSVNKPVLSYLLSRLLPQYHTFFRHVLRSYITSLRFSMHATYLLYIKSY